MTMSVKSGRGADAGLGRLQLVRPYRVIHLVAGIVYLALFLAVYRTYLSVEWGYTGLLYRPLGAGELVFVVAAVGLVSMAMPEKVVTPSSIIVWMLYAFVLVPTMAITFMTGERSSFAYIPSLAAMALVLAIGGIMADKNAVMAVGLQKPDLRFVTMLCGAFLLCSLALYYQFGDILSFSAVDDVYFQRFAASEIGGGPIGYVRTHYSNVVTALLLAAGLSRRAFQPLILLGIAASILTYMIDAGKLALIIPVIVLAFFAVIRLTSGKTYILTIGIAGLTGLSSLLVTQLSPVKIVADLLLFRSIAIPAQTFAQYADLFAARGHTYWSNVRIINLFVPPPASFSADPYWPVLGQIVGAEYYGFGSRMNANANLFVGEGVAAAGAIGVLVLGAIFVFLLATMDRAAQRWDAKFAVLATLPLALSLTNVHLSTLILSFGGFALWCVFRFYKPWFNK